MSYVFTFLVALLLGGVAGVVCGFWVCAHNTGDAVKRICGDVIAENEQLKRVVARLEAD